MRLSHLTATRTKRDKRVYVRRLRQQAAPNYLNRLFTSGRPNEKWAGDITFIPTWQGYLYLALVLEMYSRAVIGWAMSARINGLLVLNALEMSVERRGLPTGMLVHSDKGSQYTA